MDNEKKEVSREKQVGNMRPQQKVIELHMTVSEFNRQMEGRLGDRMKREPIIVKFTDADTRYVNFLAYKQIAEG